VPVRAADTLPAAWQSPFLSAIYFKREIADLPTPYMQIARNDIGKMSFGYF